MATLSLRLDPRQMETGADRAERSLDDVRRGAQQAESAVDRVGTSFSRAGQRAGGAAAAMGRVSRAFQGARGQIQNAAFQMGDFAVQVGAGTAASVALGQQLPQLLGGFGALGAVLGAVVAIGVPLAASFFRSAEGADRLSEAIKGIKTATQSARDELALLQSGLETLEELHIQQEINRLMQERTRIAALVEAGSARMTGVSEGQLIILDRQLAEQQKLLEEFRASRDALEEGREAAGLLWDTLNSIDISPLINQANTLAARFALAAQNAAAMVAASAERIQRGRQIGRGRGTFAGPSADEINTFNPGAQLATTQANIAAANAAAIRTVSGGGGGGSAVDQAAREVERVKSAYESLISTLDPLTGATLEYRDAQEAINAALDAGVITADEATRALELAKQRMEDVGEGSTQAGDAFKGFFSDALTDIKNVDDALKNLGNRLATLAANAAADTLIGNLFGGIFGSVFGSAKGNVFSGGSIVPFAKGGVVSGPTVFPMKNGTGLMGEAGPEAIMPLKRGPGGRLGISAEGGAQRVEIVVRESDMFMSTIDSRAEGISIRTTKEGLKQFSRRALPSKVNAIQDDPRRRG